MPILERLRVLLFLNRQLRKVKAQKLLEQLNTKETVLLKKRDQLSNRIRALEARYSKQLQKKRIHNLIVIGAWFAKNTGIDVIQDIHDDDIDKLFRIEKRQD